MTRKFKILFFLKKKKYLPIFVKKSVVCKKIETIDFSIKIL